MRVFLFFVDGLGLGDRDVARNPLLSARLPQLQRLLDGRLPLAGELPLHGPQTWAVPTDATLGVPGLPQSATGQTTILSGVNAARAIGRHLNGYPTPALKNILKQYSLFKQVVARGRRATFVNAYSPHFFAHEAELRREFTPGLARGQGESPAGMGVPSHAVSQELAAIRRLMGRAKPASERAARQPSARFRRYRPSASTAAVLAAGLPFRTFDDLLAGRAVFHDITHWTLGERGYDLPPVDAVEAGRRAARLASGYDFTMFEHFLTDLTGHGQQMERARAVLESVDAFIGGLLAELDGSRTLLLITSDHGNIEDLGVKTHTLHPVPTILYGPGAARTAGRIADLTHIAPAVLAALEEA